MHKPKLVLENKTTIFGGGGIWDTYYLILAWRQDLEIISQKRPQNEKRDKYLDLARELKTAMDNENDGGTNCNWWACNVLQRLGRGTENTRTSRDHLKYSIVKISLNTEKSPGYLKRLAVTQTPEKDHLLKMVWKISQGMIIKIT